MLLLRHSRLPLAFFLPLLLVMTTTADAFNFTDFFYRRVLRRNMTQTDIVLPPMSCKNALDCASRQNSFCDLDSNQCLALRSFGSACTYNDQCGTYYCDVKAQKCKVPPLVTDLAAARPNGSVVIACTLISDCLYPNLFCDTKRQQCMPRKEEGAMCMYTPECLDGMYCISGTCVVTEKQAEEFDRRFIGFVVVGVTVAVVVLSFFVFCMCCGMRQRYAVQYPLTRPRGSSWKWPRWRRQSDDASLVNVSVAHAPMAQADPPSYEMNIVTPPAEMKEVEAPAYEHRPFSQA